MVRDPGPADAGSAGNSQPYYQFEADRQVRVLPGNPQPRYPAELRRLKMNGKVVVSFVVTEAGVADMSTFKVVSSSHEQFTESVRTTLAQFRFQPATVGGRVVKAYVQLPFEFFVDPS